VVAATSRDRRRRRRRRRRRPARRRRRRRGRRDLIKDRKRHGRLAVAALDTYTADGYIKQLINRDMTVTLASRRVYLWVILCSRNPLPSSADRK
jgi:hypothetical protein